MEADELKRELAAARNWIENIIRGFDRDNVPARLEPRGVRVSITHTAAQRGRDLLRPRAERAG